MKAYVYIKQTLFIHNLFWLKNIMRIQNNAYLINEWLSKSWWARIKLKWLCGLLFTIFYICKL